MSEVIEEQDRRRNLLIEVLDAMMSGNPGKITSYFAPGAVISTRSNAGIIDAPWFDRMEGEFRLQGEEEAKSFLSELLRRATYISYELRGIVVEQDDAASRCNWTRRDERNGSLVTGTTMYWFSFTTDGRIRSIETIGSIHSVIPAKTREGAA
ncbi:nuclear transport factor 2 family protein [Mangrovicella endophytica]|uniref:nuclear transport factor 2 family protein n=1 Tax=Mangrovicella endophytica TaxID=2066697 RepID=UPI000C9DD99C|nr:nuclear transport factor 2 family protein [Mangrovicella endophytica]